MRKPPRHFPNKPSSCDLSDLLNEMVLFVQENPMWVDDEDSLAKMAIAYGILTGNSSPDMMTEGECDFILNLHDTISENRNNG
jgi:hypothetical protein